MTMTQAYTLKVSHPQRHHSSSDLVAIDQRRTLVISGNIYQYVGVSEIRDFFFASTCKVEKHNQFSLANYHRILDPLEFDDYH